MDSEGSLSERDITAAISNGDNHERGKKVPMPKEEIAPAVLTLLDDGLA